MDRFQPELIEKEHIESALRRIKDENLELIPSTKWDLVYEGKLYPPKEVMRLAHEKATGTKLWERGGGPPTNKYLEKFGFTVQNKFSKNDPILELIERYKTHRKKNKFDDELYKWKLLKEFSGRPNVESKDFSSELSSVNFSNLIYPLGIAVANHIAKEIPEKLRQAFKILFNESKELSERLNYFNKHTLELYREVETKKNVSHHQDERTMSTYLSYFDSSKYALFKDSFYQKYCKILGIKAAKPGSKYVHYMELLKEFIDEYLLKDEELLSLKNLLPVGEVHPDPNHLIYGQDILYKTLDEQVGTDRNYWRIGTSSGRSGNSYWDEMKTSSFVSIGWSEIGSLTEQEINSKRDIQKLLEQEEYYTTKSQYSRKAGEVFDFYKEMKVGDVVLAQEGSKVLGVGIISDEYYFDEEKDFAHIKPVVWKIIEPNDLKNTEGLQTTFYKLKSPDIILKVEEMLKSVSNMDNQIPRNQIFYGPPGTGKTFSTINKALELCNENITNLSRREIKELYKNKVKEGQIVFTTFHQSMSYEDFIEGIKPQEPEKEGDNIIYKVEDGIFKKLCIKANTPNQNDFNRSYDLLIKELVENESRKTLTTPTGKTFQISVNRNLNLNLYTGDKKAKQGTLTKENLQKQIKGDNIFDGWGGYFNGVIECLKSDYNYNPEATEAKNYVLIIDEINRGNIPQIFGELITLIENDKRAGQLEEIEVQLPYSKDNFSVPSNLFIIGTMNTADRSVEALDTALRRRFSFIEMPPQPEIIRTEGKLKSKEGCLGTINLVNLLKIINKRIEKLIDKDHMIGHSYFLEVSSIDDLKFAFHNKIVPLLQEYFYGDHGKIGLILGEGFFEEDSNSNDSEDVFAKFNNYEIGSLLDKPVYHLRNISEMSSEEFTNAIGSLIGKE
jgi:predicted Mrr-cat superfamily restriction endonuclease